MEEVKFDRTGKVKGTIFEGFTEDVEVDEFDKQKHRINVRLN